MFTYKGYVPVLKWKLGEYQALERLSDNVAREVIPLIEIPPIGFDFESGTQKKTVDDHLAGFGAKLKAKWGARPCMVDVHYITQNMGNGAHCGESVFHDARENGCKAIPVASLTDIPICRAAFADVIRTDRRGVCLRLREADFDRGEGMLYEIEKLLSELGVTFADTDLVIDLASQTYHSLTLATEKIRALCNMLGATMNRWRSLAVVASSFPDSIAKLRPEEGKPQFVQLPHYEWQVYKMLVKTLGGGRIPTFGDYAAAHPDLVELDMRLIKPFAKLRYTFNDHWHIAIGRSVRTYGFEQYRGMCQELVQQSYFAGADASAADKHIAECASGEGSTGNLTTWVWVSTNRHLTHVQQALATFHGL